MAGLGFFKARRAFQVEFGGIEDAVRAHLALVAAADGRRLEPDGVVLEGDLGQQETVSALIDGIHLAGERSFGRFFDCQAETQLDGADFERSQPKAREACVLSMGRG